MHCTVRTLIFEPHGFNAGLRSTAFASPNGDACEDMTREFGAGQRKIGPLESGEVGETKGGDQVRRAITP